jgi:hypothetical protein
MTWVNLRDRKLWRCERCGWTGPRREREVNYSNEGKQWLCEYCFLGEGGLAAARDDAAAR